MPTKIEGRTTDGRYRKPVDKVDKGAMSSLKIPLPVKKDFVKHVIEDNVPKQIKRQALAKLLNKARRRKHS